MEHPQRLKGRLSRIEKAAFERAVDDEYEKVMAAKKEKEEGQ